MKKVTIGVFLVLVVALVASLGVVGVADAVKPVRTVTVNITATPDGTGNCNLTANVVWDNYGTWKYDVSWYVDKGSGFERFNGTRVYLMKRTITGELVTAVPPEKIRLCDYDYRVEVQLLRNSGKPIRGAYADDEGYCGCH